MLVIIKRTSLLVKIAFKASEVKFCLLCEDTQFQPILNCINQILLSPQQTFIKNLAMSRLLY